MKESTSLLNVIYQNEDGLLNQVKLLLDAGADPSEETEYCETPLRVASNNGCFDVVNLLLESGADPDHLKWTEIFHTVAFGSVDDVKKRLAGGDDLSVRDFWERTPYLLAIQVGDIDKVKLLLEAGADLDDKGRCNKLPLEYAIQSDDETMLRLLVDLGYNPEEYNYFAHTPLMEAAEQGAIKCVKALIDIGVDIFKKDRSQFSGKTAISQATTAEIVRVLVDAGDDLNDCENEVRAELLGLGKQEVLHITQQEYAKQKQRCFGRSNPELCSFKFWYEMVRCNAGAWKARTQFKETDAFDDPPVWCYERFGKSITDLGNGEYIEIAGEHEDHYDPDFCIYNEVFHHRGQDEFDIYMYPKAIFPPTDFHTATLVDGFIYIIGNLGYPEDRAYGTTPCYRLNIKTFEIENIETTGDNPGWIYKHKAYVNNKSVIRLKGGEIVELKNKKEVHQKNEVDYELCLKSLTWSRHEHVPMEKEPGSIPAEYKEFEYMKGMLLASESDSKWILTKIIQLHRVDIEKGQVIIVADKEFTSPVDDFLFVVISSISHEFKSLAALERAVTDRTWTIQKTCVARLPTEFSDNYRFLEFEDVTKEELCGYERWNEKFEQDNAADF